MRTQSFLMAIFLMKMTHGNTDRLVETLFRDKIQAAVCMARCAEAGPGTELEQCGAVCGIMWEDADQYADLCSMASVCVGGCRLACDTDDRDTSADTDRSLLTMGGMEQCRVHWSAHAANTPVVAVVVARDQGGKWNLVNSGVREQSMELTYREADKMVELQILPVDSRGLGDIISLDITTNDCVEYVPEPFQWTEEESTDETDNAGNNNVIIIIILTSVCAVCLVSLIIVIMVRVRTIQTSSRLPELPYSPPVKFPAPTAYHVITIQGRSLPTIPGNDEYEEIVLSK